MTEDLDSILAGVGLPSVANLNPAEFIFANNMGVRYVMGELHAAIKEGRLERIEQMAEDSDSVKECSGALQQAIREGEPILATFVQIALSKLGLQDYETRFTTEGRCNGLHRPQKGGPRQVEWHDLSPTTRWLSRKEYQGYLVKPNHLSFESKPVCSEGGETVVTASYFTCIPSELAALERRAESHLSMFRHTATEKKKKQEEWIHGYNQAEAEIAAYLRSHSMAGASHRVKLVSSLEKLSSLFSSVPLPEKKEHPLSGIWRDFLGFMALGNTDAATRQLYNSLLQLRCLTPLPDTMDSMAEQIKKRADIQILKRTFLFTDTPIEIQGKSREQYFVDKADRIDYKRSLARSNLDYERQALASPGPGRVSPYLVLRTLGRLFDLPVFIPSQSAYAPRNVG